MNKKFKKLSDEFGLEYDFQNQNYQIKAGDFDIEILCEVFNKKELEELYEYQLSNDNFEGAELIKKAIEKFD